MGSHTGLNEKTERFGGQLFRKKHTVRSLKSARKWKNHYEENGYYVRVEHEKIGVYNVYVRRK